LAAAAPAAGAEAETVRAATELDATERAAIEAALMETRGNRDKVLQELRTHLGRDRARTKAFAVSDLGLIEMTRQRVRPSLWQSMTADCPTCTGTGRVFRPEVVVRRMERSLKRAGADHKERQLAVTKAESEHAFAYETTDGVASAYGLVQVTGKLDDELRYLERLRGITREQIRDAARKYMPVTDYARIAFVPGKKK